MAFALGIVTVLALVLTIGMGVVTWRLVREERKRSAARLAVLTAELRRDDPGERRPTSHASSSEALGRQVESPDRSSSMLAEEPLPSSTPVIGMFQGRPEETGQWTRRLAGFGVAGAVLAAVAGGAPLTSTARSNVVPDRPHAPVELLSLRHKQDDGALAITGTLRNPGKGRVERRLTVMALTLDRDGLVVATAHAPVGQESPPTGAQWSFAVSLPAGDATRFRISFLVDDTPVPHLDHRELPTAAPRGTIS